MYESYLFRTTLRVTEKTQGDRVMRIRDSALIAVKDLEIGL